MKLELKHLTPYLPYGVGVGCNHYVVDKTDLGIISKYNFLTGVVQFSSKEKDYNTGLEYIKPILRPLSDLTKEMGFGTHKSYPMQEFYIMYGAGSGSKKQFEKNYYENIIYTSYLSLSYEAVSKLFEWHFDVFGLIEKGLAIDINTLQDD